MNTLSDFISKTLNSIYAAAEHLTEQGHHIIISPMQIETDVIIIDNKFYVPEYPVVGDLKVQIIINGPNHCYINILN